MARNAPQVVVTVTAEALVTKFRGAHSESVKYQPGEWVLYEKELWACQQTNEKVVPVQGSPYWSLIGSLE